ncbi:hypothetical protein BHE74_00058513 [Ensete ventricosum]|nr:hypothetical protein BHE74_00058513 [Ensete ventricosum]
MDWYVPLGMENLADGYRLYRAVRAGPPADQYVDRSLSGDTVGWGCFHPVTTRNRPKKREKKRENLEIWHCSPDLVSSLAGDFFSPRGLSPHREKERGDYRHTAPYRAEFGMTVRYGLAYEIVVEMAAYL